MKEKRYMTIIKSLLLAAASFAFLSCSNLTGGNSSESSSDNNSSDKAQTITITGSISISEEITASGALPAEYLFLINQIKDSNERAAIPSYPSNPSQDKYYATATKDGTNFINGDITKNGSDVKFTMVIPIDDTPTTWTIEAGLKDTFNGSQAIILKDTYSKSFSNTDPSFSHPFIIRPLTTGSGNIDLTINYETSDANKPDSVELYFGEDEVTAGEGEEISAPASNSTTSKITLKNRLTGTYKARLVFKKNGYVVFTDYQGITVFPNLTTNTWVYSKSGIYTPINSSGVYKLTDAQVEDYLITQIYVGNVTIGSTTIPGKDDTGNGTIFAPFATFAKAITFLKENGKEDKDYTIWISGVHTGPFTIQDETSPAKPVKAKSLTISGYTGNTTDKLNGGSSGSVLYLDTDVPVKIKNLTITGGKGTSVSSTLYGGGIYINKGSVELTTGVVVDGNTADVGGGVYLADGTLYLNDTAVVGKPLSALGANPTCAGTTSGTYANKATEKGGGIAINAGTLWLGYTQGESQAQAKDTSGGVIYNLVTSTGATQGGGIDNYNGIINIARGVVSYNYASGTGSGSNDVGSGGGIATNKTLELQGNAEISHNESAYGGAVYIGNGGSFTMSAGTITENASKKQHTKWGDGGGIAIGGGGNFYMSGGTVSSNTAEGKGGAVYHTGTTFEISGSTAEIPKGTNETNNIQLETTTQKIKIAGSTNSGDGGIAITPARWNRGDQIFDNGSETSYFGKFKLTDSEWSIVSYTVGNNTTGRIDAPLYVAGTTAQTISGVSYGAGKTPANGGLGTKAKPYSTIDDAVAQCWHGPNDTVTNTGRTITIVGTVRGGHTISSSITTTANATAITLAGVNTDATLNGGFSSGSSHEGRPLTISTAVPIIIQNLTIKGGYTTDGGGIYVSAAGAKLTLTTGAKVTGNTVTNGSGGGGGIYIAGTSTSKANLIMNSTAQIYGNTGRNSTAEVKGGGAYLSYTNLCMAGSAIIGAYQGTGTSAAQNSGGQYSNFAYKYGGGVYCDKNSSVWLGYSEAAANKTSALTAGYGIVYNYASSDGGGLYCLGQIHMASGSVSNNGCGGSYAGGIYLYTDANGTASMEMSGGALSYNVCTFYGGGIYVKGASSLSLSGTGTTLVSNTVTGSSGLGGAIYLNSTSSFNIKDCPSIASSGPKNNDVYLGKTTSNGVATRAVVKINGALSGSGNIMNLTCGSWDRGIKLVTRTDGNKMDDTTMARFSTSQSGWQKMLSHDELSMVINQPIYVRGADYVKFCTGTANSTNSGTTASPLDSLESIKNLLTDSTAEYLVYLDGSLTTSQNLSSAFDGKAAALTIKGPSGWAGTNRDALYGSYTAASPGTMLIIGTTLPITLENIQIHGGHATSSNAGGGIRISGCKADVTLKGLYIQDNHSTNEGGAGIVADSDVANGSKLNIIGCRVEWNVMYHTNNIGYSGVGLDIWNCSITINIKDGDFQNNKVDFTGTSASSPRINGVGLCLGNSATTTLDGVTINYNEYTNLPDGKTADVLGGGLYLQGGTLTIKGNSKIENNTAKKGGGLYINANASPRVTLESGSQIRNNTATLGPDVCRKSSGTTFTNNGGTIGTAVATE